MHLDDHTCVKKHFKKTLTRESLTTRGTTQQQRHLTVSHRLLGQIVVDDQGVLAGVTEPLSLCVCVCVASEDSKNK